MTNEQFRDWKWQERNSLRSAKDIKKFFPNFPEEEIKEIAKYEKTRRWGITPYTLSLMTKDDQGNPSPQDPIVRQTFPIRGFRLDAALDSYDGKRQPNWELTNEMPTPILQHKYTKKVILRVPNACLGYCGYCFEVERVEDKESKKGSINDLIWQRSLRYIGEHPIISEVILSGGDPLLMDNTSLESRIADIRNILSVRAIRIHTRAFTFNPFRIDDELVDILKRHKVTEIGLHISHPNELTSDVKDALERSNEGGYGSILKMGQTPLLKEINDDSAVLEELFMRMYADFQIKPYYLYHSLPWSPASLQYRTSVKKGVRLMNSLKRHISSVAIPEYAIVHHNGKHTVPLEENGTSEFQYTQDEAGNPIVRFKNWRGNWETYFDGRD